MKKTSTMIPIPPNVAEVLAVFTDELQKVVFPDVSAESLKKLSDQVNDKVKLVGKVATALAAAQEELEKSQQDLAKQAAHALAYARIYAEDKPELAQRLNAINLRLPKPPKKGKAKVDKAKTDKPKTDKLANKDMPAKSAPAQAQAAK